MQNELFLQLGFTDKEAAIYRTLFQRGANSVSVLAHLTKIKRTSVYDILKSLLARGLIVSFQQASTTYFAIDDVQKLELEQKEKLSTAHELITELKANALSTANMQVTYYRGKEGYRQMYEDMLAANPKEFNAWMNPDNFYQGIDSEREVAWTLERIKKNIYARLLLIDSKQSRAMQREDKKLFREIELIPAKAFPFESSCILYDDHVTFFHTEKSDFTGVRIHHPEMFKLQKQIFEMCWRLF